MDLQFQKVPISYMRTVSNEIQTQEQTQEVRLPDGMPDVGHVIASWAQVLVRGKEWRGGSAGISGGVMVWVLYAPEDGSAPQCVDVWLPFQMKVDVDATQQDGTICAMPLLQNVDARSVSARKLMVRSGVSMLMCVQTRDKAETCIPDDLPEDVCVLQNMYPMLLAKEFGEKAFVIEENLELPGNIPMPGKLVYYKLHPVITEQKIMTDKLIFRGMAKLHLLYMDAQGELHNWSGEVPFSQYSDLSRDYVDTAVAVLQPVVTSLEVEYADGRLLLKAGILAQYTVYDREEVTVVEDAYSPRRKIAPHTEYLRLPAILDTMSETVYVQQLAENPLVDAMFCPDMPRLYRDDDGIRADLSGTFYALDRTDEGQLQGTTKTWEESKLLQADPNVVTEVVMGYADVSVSGNKMESELPMTVRYLADHEMPVITGMELGELRESDPERPSLILCRRGEQSLWDIAKHTGSTVEIIQKANGLTQEPEPDKMLLIPIV